jgi:teichuronic acid biosynthesis glycosyltransferase TuaC
VSRSLRVLAVTNTYPSEETPGDTPCIRDQVLALRAQGVQVDLLHIDRSTGKRGYAQAAWHLFLSTFQPRRYDLIHAYYGHCGLLARLQAKYPVVVTFRGSDLLSAKDGAIGRIVARLVGGVIVMTEEMKLVTKRLDAQVIPFGVDLSVFAPYPVERARRELELPSSAKLVLFPWDPARAVKRFDIVQEAMALLKDKRQDVSLIVIFDKPHAIVAKHMNACDAMVLASDHEGSPMAVREAMACNLPIVSVDVGDVRQIIGDTEGCYLCQREASDVAEKLSWVLKRGSRTNGAQVIGRMDAAWAAERVLSVYEYVLNSNHLS